MHESQEETVKSWEQSERGVEAEGRREWEGYLQRRRRGEGVWAIVGRRRMRGGVPI
jgi:hypothetical protein